MKDNTNDNMVHWIASALKTTKNGLSVKNTELQCDIEEAGELLQHSANVAIFLNIMTGEIDDLLDSIEEIGLSEWTDLNMPLNRMKAILAQVAMYMVKNKEINNKLIGGDVQ
jgi:ACT domain-containing protein